ncbi:hypothetical protein [Mycoplasma sp. 1458C]|uniref:hypothetical protein n=1 Tax=unclassified Mycoplasma TaxID=2683645 RepID=UPI003AAF677B
MKKNKNELDQFFTNPIVTDKLAKKIIELFRISIFERQIIEPSAGSGNFVKSLLKLGIKRKNIKAFDIDVSFYPYKNIKQCDYLTEKIEYSENNIIIGNPPFGKRAKKAIDFINKGLTEAPYVCFVLPNTFKRYLTQNKIIPEAELIYEIDLDSNSFLIDNREYDVNCVFQIWANKKAHHYLNNLRKAESDIKKSPDFTTFIYNNTYETLKYFDKTKYKWDFAIVRQGFYNYNEFIFEEKELKSNRQYLFVKLEKPEFMKIFNLIDFNKIVKNNTSIPGFSLTDLIKEYNKIKYSVTLIEAMIEEHDKSKNK